MKLILKLTAISLHLHPRPIDRRQTDQTSTIWPQNKTTTFPMSFVQPSPSRQLAEMRSCTKRTPVTPLQRRDGVLYGTVRYG